MKLIYLISRVFLAWTFFKKKSGLLCINQLFVYILNLIIFSRPKEVVSLLLDDEELERKYNVQTSDKSGTTTPGNEESVDIEGLFTFIIISCLFTIFLFF